jgi:hypothetical protein
MAAIERALASRAADRREHRQAAGAVTLSRRASGASAAARHPLNEGFFHPIEASAQNADRLHRLARKGVLGQRFVLISMAGTQP